MVPLLLRTVKISKFERLVVHPKISSRETRTSRSVDFEAPRLPTLYIEPSRFSPKAEFHLAVLRAAGAINTFDRAS